MKFKNNYYIMRHGEARSNVRQIISSWPEKFYNPLTAKGKKAVEQSAEKIKEKNIDLIFCSPVLRTKQTAEIVGNIIDIKPVMAIDLMEQDVGVFNGKPFATLKSFFGAKEHKRFNKRPENGETYVEIQERMVNFLKKTDENFKRKNILIVSHELPLVLLDCAVKEIKNEEFYVRREKIEKAEFRKL